jgi:hypothetical protein
MYNTHFLGNLFSPDISVPYLNVYEASNAYTFYFTNSIYKEYKDKFTRNIDKHIKYYHIQ